MSVPDADRILFTDLKRLLKQRIVELEKDAGALQFGLPPKNSQSAQDS